MLALVLDRKEARVVTDHAAPALAAGEALIRECGLRDVLIEARYPLSRADEALAHAGRRGTLEVLIDAGN